jgi:hypothetical protein
MTGTLLDFEAWEVAGQNARELVMWFLIVISSALGTVDLYPAGSREECHRLAERIRAADAHPQTDVQMACVEDSRVEGWLRENRHYVPQSE